MYAGISSSNWNIFNPMTNIHNVNVRIVARSISPNSGEWFAIAGMLDPPDTKMIATLMIE